MQSFQQEKTCLYTNVRRKIIEKERDDVLIEKQLLSTRSVYLCTACAEYAYENFILPPKEKRPKHYVDTVILLIEDGDIDEDDMARIAEAIGKSQHDKFHNESMNDAFLYKSEKFLHSYNPYHWIHEQNSLVLSFLKSLCNINENSNGRNFCHWSCVMRSFYFVPTLTSFFRCLFQRT